MDTFTIVRPEHLNHHGYLFGGQMLKWVDEDAWLVAARDFPGYSLVTRAMDQIDFRHRILNGSILRLHILPFRQGTTSITYRVEVYAQEPCAEAGETGPLHGAPRAVSPEAGLAEKSEKLVFSNHVTFVCVDERGNKRALPRRERLPSQC
ncbi:MAG: acyl-CoA thioesterase [Spirochaetota bacterium]